MFFYLVSALSSCVASIPRVFVFHEDQLETQTPGAPLASSHVSERRKGGREVRSGLWREGGGKEEVYGGRRGGGEVLQLREEEEVVEKVEGVKGKERRERKKCKERKKKG